MGWAGICFFAAMAFILQVSNGEPRHGMDHGQWAKEKSILCYECNSAYDPRCGDPFDPYTIGVVNCSKKRPMEHLQASRPTLCRKTVQKVQGNLRVIRGCGYILDRSRDDKECFIRTGTKDVHINYCSCKSSLCNGSVTFSLSTRSFLSIAILFAILVIVV